MITRIFSYILILVLASAPGFAQSSGHADAQSGTAAVAAASPAIPKDPTDLMLLAAKVNGLGSIVAQPWHVKANFKTFDADGKPKDKGTFEEWWAGPEKYKLSYKSGSDRIEDLYQDGDKRMMTGHSPWPSIFESMSESSLVSPLPDESAIRSADYIPVKKKMGPVTLECLRPSAQELPSPPGAPANHWTGPQGAPQVPTTCFTPGRPIIRMEIFSEGLLTLFNDVAQVRGHYFARDIWVENVNAPLLNLKVTEIDFPPKIEDTELKIPAEAKVVAPKTGKVMEGHKIGGKAPVYPWFAKSQRVQGLVILSAHINKAGNIENLQVISGPKALREPSLDAVKTWKYTPYLLNGSPVEVETQINVIYMLGSG